jgi:magnesium transporter
LTQLRKNTMLLVKRLDVDPSNVHLHDILNVRDNVLVVLSVAEEQSQCLAMIRSMDEDTDAVDFDNLLGVVSVLVSTAASTELMCQRLEKRAKNLKDTYEALQQARLNRRLALLTVVSAIFMPLTFMAGVYGMNFDNMPELHYDNGYFYLMGAMGFVVVTMVTGFWMNGWFE